MQIFGTVVTIIFALIIGASCGIIYAAVIESATNKRNGLHFNKGK